MPIIAEIVLALIGLVLKAVPALRADIAAGKISVGAQTVLRSRYTAMREAFDPMFTGPEWDVTEDAPQPPTT